MSHRRSAKWLAIVTGVCAFSNPRAFAQNWTASTSGSWSVVANWQGNVAPTSSTTTSLNFLGTGSYTATNDIVDPFTLNQLNLSNTSSLLTLNGSALLFNGNLQQINQLGSSAVSINNVIQIHSTGLNTDTLNVGGSGAGTITLSQLSSTIAPTDTGGAGINMSDPLATLNLTQGATLFSIRENAGSIVLNGGTWNCTSQQHRNDGLLGQDDGPWGLSIGETAGAQSYFTMNGGHITAPSAFVSIVPGAKATATFKNGAIADFTGDNGRFGINASDGTVNILSGAHVSCRLAYFGRQFADVPYNAFLVVDGAGSRLDTGTFVMSESSANGTLYVSGGGVISVSGDANVGYQQILGADQEPVNTTAYITSGARFDATGDQIWAGGQGGAVLNLWSSAEMSGNNVSLGGDDGEGTFYVGGTLTAATNSYASGFISSVSVDGTWHSGNQWQLGGGGWYSQCDDSGGTITTGGNSYVYYNGTLSIGHYPPNGGNHTGTFNSGGDMEVDGTVFFYRGALSVHGQLNVGGSVVLSDAGRSGNGTPANKKVLEAGSIAFTPSGFIDLSDNDALLHTNTLTDVEGFIRTGRNGGAWDGNQLVSTAAKNNLQHNTTLGAITGAQFKSANGATATFDSDSVSDSDVLVKYTFFGDANFNGKVDGGDYARIDTSFNNEHTGGNISGWFNGDFDYNGKVDGADYALIDAAFDSQNAVVLSRPDSTIPAGLPDDREIISTGMPGAIAWTPSSAPNVVPEPAIAFACCGLLLQRRRRGAPASF